MLLPSTRTWSPWIWVWTLAPLDFTNFVISFVFSSAMPGHDGDGLPHVALRGRVDLALGERLQRHVALDGLLLQDLQRGLQPVLGRGPELDRRVVLGDAGLGVLEVEPLRDLALRLVDGVANLLQVHLGDDVERELVFRHAREDTVLRSATVRGVRYHVTSREDARVAKGSGL